MKSGIDTALEFLKNNKGEYFCPEEIHKFSSEIGISVPTLCRKLRNARQRGKVVSRIRDGKTYVEYAFFPNKDKPFYFFTIPMTPMPSALYSDMEKCKKDLSIWGLGNIWTGSHDNPIHVEALNGVCSEMDISALRQNENSN